VVVGDHVAHLHAGWGGWLALELVEDLGRDRCVVGLSVSGYRADSECDVDGWPTPRTIEIERACVSKSGLFGFVDALKAWAELPLERLRTSCFTHEVELARGFPERIGLAMGPPPRYTRGDRVLLKLHTRLGGESSTVAFGFDVSGAAVFVDEVHDATGARSPLPRR
jgi:hypothetical protein